MGREVRRVAERWHHPRNEVTGDYVPMYEHFPYNEEEIEEGLREGWLTNDPPNYGCNVMPQWTKEERVLWQWYECTSEGTPLSPGMESAEALAGWLAKYDTGRMSGRPLTADQWMSVLRGEPLRPSEAGRGAARLAFNQRLALAVLAQSRAVLARYDPADGGMVSTSGVGDGHRPFETLVSSPDYHHDVASLSDATIVEAYDTEEEARSGHARWVGLYGEGELPDPLVDCGNATNLTGVTTSRETPRKATT